MAEESKLVRKRGAVKRLSTGFEQFLKPVQSALDKGEDIPEKTIVELEGRLDKFKSLLTDFNNVQDEIECMCSDSELEKQYEERDEFTARHHSVLADAKMLLNRLRKVSAGSSSHTASSPAAITLEEVVSHLEGMNLPTTNLCEQFQKLAIPERIQKIKELRLCTNCLCAGHRYKDCKAGTCRKCNKKHSTLLHLEQAPAPTPPTPQATSSEVSLASSTESRSVLLSTILCSVSDSSGKCHTVRAILDCGSQSNFISESLCKQLRLHKYPTNISVVGINNVASNLKYKCDMSIKSIATEFSINISCFLLSNSISERLPISELDIQSWNIPKGLKLADPKFNIPSEIHILIGAEHFWNILISEKINLGKSLPVLQNSQFGWLVSGAVAGYTPKIHCKFSQSCDIDTQLQKFWEIEQVNEVSSLSSDDEKCETHYQNTVTRNPCGRFVVKIPMHTTESVLGDSMKSAIKCLQSLENKFQNNPDLKHFYVDDLITGFESEQEAITICKQIISVLNQSKFPLRKWVSNSPRVLQEIQDNSDPISVLFLGDNEHSKTLGIQWLGNSVDEIPELRKQTLSVTLIQGIFPFDKYSSLKKVKNVMAYCLRFISNMRLTKSERAVGELTVNELDKSLEKLIWLAQHESFSEEYKLLTSNKNLNGKSALIRLSPFLDQNGLIRVGGRLKNSSLLFGEKHPLLLSKNHRLTFLIFAQVHLDLFHPGPQLLLSTVRQNYWSTSGRAGVVMESEEPPDYISKSILIDYVAKEDFYRGESAERLSNES
ncbi:hypothetical protein NQ315_005009 [Exocentrus adspersus]|uniref:Peptidase aspartic putative domain-containing protein n=1 Tax=Exocentrus adspersus TaxID=1586481 RepID=A0AAV8VQ52_9CUCU|nr:hypothetical protein NQ315_005009 [Exocentrus adspersus]